MKLRFNPTQLLAKVFLLVVLARKTWCQVVPTTFPPAVQGAPTMPLISKTAIRGVTFTGADQEAWTELNAALHPFLLRDGFVTQSPAEVQLFFESAKQDWVQTICEIGFNAGHGAMLFLQANPKAVVYSFDLALNEYTEPAAQVLEKRFPGRFNLVAGESSATLPRFAKEHPNLRCDLSVVDGGHDEKTVASDLANLRALANPAHHVVYVLDTPCNMDWCKGRTAAFDAAATRREILPIARLPIDSWRGISSAWFMPEMSSLPQMAAPVTTAPSFLSFSRHR